MNKEKNQRLDSWYKMAKSFGIIKNQSELAEKLTAKDGTSINQPYLNNILRSKVNLPEHIINQVVNIYPFTNKAWITFGTGTCIDKKALTEYLGAKQNVRLANVAIFEDNDKYYDFVFKHFNNEFGYKISLESINNPDVSVKKDHYNAQTQRFTQIVDYLLAGQYAKSLSDLSEKVNSYLKESGVSKENWLTQQKITNMRTGLQGVRMSHLEGLALAFKFINVEWVITNRGHWQKSISDSAYQIQLLSQQLNELTNFVKERLSAQELA